MRRNIADNKRKKTKYQEDKMSLNEEKTIMILI